MKPLSVSGRTAHVESGTPGGFTANLELTAVMVVGLALSFESQNNRTLT